MKNENRKLVSRRALIFLTSLTLACTLAIGGFSLGMTAGAPAIAETTQAQVPGVDPSPAIYVAQKNANSVVGVTTYSQMWNRSSGEVEESPRSQGSGVVIAEGGYVLTNNHVVDSGDGYKVLLPNGERAPAILKGVDASMDIAVLKVDDEYVDQLVPVTVGVSSDLIVGGTVIAIGNPGTDNLANTVTQGIVSALNRSSIYGSNTTRNVDYIQHDATINSGNSGGGLFNYRGELVGINTLKYGSSFSGYEGLAFAIPIDEAYPAALQLIEKGRVVRPQMGIMTKDQEGPNEPTGNYPPASVLVASVNADSPAERAGMKQYDFIYAVDDVRVKSFRELTAVLDKHQAGDTVKITVVRYNNAYTIQPNYNNYNNYNNYGGYGGYGGYGDIFGSIFGFTPNYGGSMQNDGSDSQLVVEGGFEFEDLHVTLELPKEG